MSSEWQIKKFGDLVDFVSSKSKAEDAELQTYISTENMEPNFGGTSVPRTTPSSGGVTNFRVGDTLFSNIRTYFKKVWQATFNGTCSNDVLVFRTKNQNILHSDYLYHLSCWEKFTELSVRTSKGAKMPRGDKSALAQFEFGLPSLAEQRAISNILKNLNNHITLLRETNATLEAIAQALFKSWFVDFDPVHANAGTQALSLPPEIQALFPATFTDSPLGPIPEGWQISNIGEVCNFQNGYAFKSNEMSKAPDNTYKIFKMGNIKKGGGLNRSGTKDYYEKNKAASLNRYLIKKGDLLMCMTDMKNNVALLGHTALMDVDNEFLLNQRVGMIRTRNPKIVNYPFLFILTNSDSFLNDIRMRANSGVQVNLSTNEIISTEFVLPPTDVHSAFNDVAEGLFEKLFVNEQQLDYLADLRDTLLPRLISGQLRLPETEPVIAAIMD